VQITASGEVLALRGYDFPPASPDDPAFADGWEMRFDKMIVVFGDVTLSENPDTMPSDQSKTGKLVAASSGPWAVDLHRGGPLAGKAGSGEQALAIDTIVDQNMNGGEPFDATQTYAFGFRSLGASPQAQVLNFDANDADYLAMVQNGWSVLYVGTATWKGSAANPACTTTNSAYDFSKLPQVVRFRFGFTTNPTAYINCQNPDNDPAASVNMEEHKRGIQIPSEGAIAQVTFHSDHPFWESFVHDSPAHFDQLAALAKKQSDGSFLVTLDDTVGVNYRSFTDAEKNPLPWRACAPGYTPPNSAAQMGFDSLSISFNPSGDPHQVMRDYHDYMQYNQSTQGHLNSDGLCFVRRGYPSPQ
jgi:hypothetical protein